MPGNRQVTQLVVPLTGFDPALSAAGFAFDSGRGYIRLTGSIDSSRAPWGSWTRVDQPRLLRLQDIQPPAFRGCPGDVELELGDSTSVTTWSWVVPRASDNAPAAPKVRVQAVHVDGIRVVVAPIAGSRRAAAEFPVDRTLVSYRATDNEGNTASCNFTVHVVDKVAPRVQCPEAATHLLNDTSSAVEVDVGPISALDNSGNVSCSATVSGSRDYKMEWGACSVPQTRVFGIGLANIIIRARDPSGNTASCSYSIEATVPDAPVAEGSGGGGASADIIIGAAVIPAVILMIIIFLVWRTRQRAHQVLPEVMTLEEIFEVSMLEMWEVDRNQVNLSKEIGKGQFGVVFKGEYNPERGDPVPVAIKMFNGEDPTLSLDDKRDFLREAEVSSAHVVGQLSLVTLHPVGPCQAPQLLIRAFPAADTR